MVLELVRDEQQTLQNVGSFFGGHRHTQEVRHISSQARSEVDQPRHPKVDLRCLDSAQLSS